ncbi:iron chelate uptake ABC transporter family permease subunit [Staphylococcus chromogenes]|uniref:iron chelate uptake ABC transporter family permease subunit n=1 Tax=Staphylococcus chromogenes TaxID=46126 RepID=UPI0035D08486
MIPQLVQRITFGGLETKIVFNLLIGGTVMVFADSLGSQLFAPIQLPASIVLAILGIPFMFYLMWMENKKIHHV